MLGAAVVGAVVVGAFVVGFAVVVEAVIVCVGHIRNIKKDHLIRKHINLFLRWSSGNCNCLPRS